MRKNILRTLAVIFILACYGFVGGIEAYGAETRYGPVNGSINVKAVEHLTGDCVSARITDVRSDKAAEMLPGICLQDVLDNYWNSSSRRKLQQERKHRRR